MESDLQKRLTRSNIRCPRLYQNHLRFVDIQFETTNIAAQKVYGKR